MLECGFLFTFYSNYGAILYRLRDIATYWSKIAKFYTHLYLVPAQGVTPSEFRKTVWIRKTKMLGLPCSGETMTICCHFDRILKRDRQTDRQTDRRTDGRRKLLYQCRKIVGWRAVKTHDQKEPGMPHRLSPGRGNHKTNSIESLSVHKHTVWYKISYSSCSFVI